MRLTPRATVSFVQRHFAAEAAAWTVSLVATLLCAQWIMGNAVLLDATTDSFPTAGFIVAFGCFMAWMMRRDRRLNRRKPLDNLRFRGRLLDSNAIGVLILAATVLYGAVTYDRGWLALGAGLAIAPALAWLIVAWRRASPDSAS
jgi:hypothetical protein